VPVVSLGLATEISSDACVVFIDNSFRGHEGF
jgi:hypothetical protein